MGKFFNHFHILAKLYLIFYRINTTNKLFYPHLYSYSIFISFSLLLYITELYKNKGDNNSYFCVVILSFRIVNNIIVNIDLCSINWTILKTLSIITYRISLLIFPHFLLVNFLHFNFSVLVKFCWSLMFETILKREFFFIVVDLRIVLYIKNLIFLYNILKNILYDITFEKWDNKIIKNFN